MSNEVMCHNETSVMQLIDVNGVKYEMMPKGYRNPEDPRRDHVLMRRIDSESNVVHKKRLDKELTVKEVNVLGTKDSINTVVDDVTKGAKEISEKRLKDFDRTMSRKMNDFQRKLDTMVAETLRRFSSMNESVKDVDDAITKLNSNLTVIMDKFAKLNDKKTGGSKKSKANIFA